MARQVAAARLQHRVLIWARSRFEVDTLRRRIASSFGKQARRRAASRANGAIFTAPLLCGCVAGSEGVALRQALARCGGASGPGGSPALFLSDAAAPWRGSSERHWMVWVVDDVRRMAELARYGVRHLISNNPRKMEVARQQLLHRCPNS
ncbi:hypothetical protein AB1Y20_023532 [Prymnesium parvum]|uniref:Uncharacterized protein n=1 Tax=Prymnesium parvum TaxID=97485 RepID=A0AB34JH01_PRYPA